jgi:hypothetical protein
VTITPEEPVVRAPEKLHAPVVIEPVVVVVVMVPPVRAALTFAIVAESAPKDERSESIDWTCEDVRPAASAVAANERAPATIARPVATAATFAIVLVDTNFIIEDL